MMLEDGVAYRSRTISDHARHRLSSSDTRSLPRSSLPSASTNFPLTLHSSISFSFACSF